LARLLLAGQLKRVAIPPDWLEAIRHLGRARERVRRDPAGDSRTTDRWIAATARVLVCRPSPAIAGLPRLRRRQLADLNNPCRSCEVARASPRRAA
jgi:hypothetical protein